MCRHMYTIDGIPLRPMTCVHSTFWPLPQSAFPTLEPVTLTWHLAPFSLVMIRKECASKSQSFVCLASAGFDSPYTASRNVSREAVRLVPVAAFRTNVPRGRGWSGPSIFVGGVPTCQKPLDDGVNLNSRQFPERCVTRSRSRGRASEFRASISFIQ